ncbi:MAG: hypothetical protein VX341_14090 [Bdellovibrionota bacterium]|nr:hypothetical protein [Bdellovibrionota bacterium]
MKSIILSFLILGSLPSFAESCVEKAALKVIETVLEKKESCNRSNLGNIAVQQVLYTNSTQSTIFEISYKCEEEGSALVIFDDECNGEGRFVSL